jgi:hypothetical protein
MNILCSRFGLVKTLMFLFLAATLSSCAYMKMNPPPDADKPCVSSSTISCDNTCYLATASNMLAGAGYGDGTTVQARADDIYGEMTTNFGTSSSGWTDTALTWWLGSSNNTWANNPYTVVTVHGNKTKTPWANQDGAKDIGNELRGCNFVGLSISWPPTGTGTSATGGHAITGWGDNLGNAKTLSVNPTEVRLVDSDTDSGGDVQVYEYDDYTNPNPSGNNSGNGWYFDYGTNHPFIKHIATLSPLESSSGGETTQRMFGSYKIHQNSEVAATDLHYKVSTDVEILSYRTWLSWETKKPPTITEADPRRNITVDWDLSERPVPLCKWVTINTEFILPRWNAISYSDVAFTYPEGEAISKASIAWRMDTPRLRNASKIPNVTGGYVVGSFDLIDPEQNQGKQLIGSYRFVHQYSFDQTPEIHVVSVIGESKHLIANLRFGHTYGYPTERTLWEFNDWLSDFSEKTFSLAEEPLKLELDWSGKLPYPEGEVVPWFKDPSLRKLYIQP